MSLVDIGAGNKSRNPKGHHCSLSARWWTSDIDVPVRTLLLSHIIKGYEGGGYGDTKSVRQVGDIPVPGTDAIPYYASAL